MSFHDRADALLRRVLAIPDAALEGEFKWRDHDFFRRHGIYMVTEELLAAADAQEEGDGGEAGRLAGHVVAAEWDLRSVILPLEPELIDLDPGSGEWTLRQTLSHVLDSQDYWGWGIAWWADHRRRGEEVPLRPRRADLPERLLIEDRRFEGDAAGLAEQLDELTRSSCHDLMEAAALGLLHEPQVAFNGRPELPVDMAYYPRRWAAHLREHTVQVEKTLVLLGRVPSEQERMARVIGQALGQLEAAWWRGGRRSGLEAVLEPAETHLASVESAMAVTPGG
ncbi:MAG TPA: hypothetical protein VJQ84_00945 [Solirubrobacterales bacterium]|nr:hypothetical protein [Solirubrobacterales bacterium]